MTASRPPRFALWVLRRCGVDNESLVGDLIEEHGARRSQPWLWRQVAGAVLARSGPGSHTGPLGIGDPRMVRPAPGTGCRARPRIDVGGGRGRTAPASRAPARGQRPRIDLSAGPVPGVGGLSTLALVFQVTLVSPQLLWLPVIGLAVGSLAGLALIARHRREPYRATRAAPLVLPGLR